MELLRGVEPVDYTEGPWGPVTENYPRGEPPRGLFDDV